MIFRSTTTATLVVLLATTAANFASTANAQTSQGLCPLVSPVTNLDEREGGSCNFMSEECRYVPITGAPVCPTGTNFQCRCGGPGLAYVCSCRGEGTAAAPVALTSAPVAPTDAPVAPTDAPVAPTDAPVAPTDAPVAPTDAPVAPTDAPVAPTDAPVAPIVAPTDATTDVEEMNVGMAQAASGASTNMVSTLMVSGAAIATLALGL